MKSVAVWGSRAGHLRPAAPEVLVGVAQDLAAAHRRLANRSLALVIVAQHRAVDLLELLDQLLDDQTVGEVRRTVDRLDELFAVVRRGDAHARARIGGLHDHGIAQFPLDAVDDGLFLVLPLLVRKQD